MSEIYRRYNPPQKPNNNCPSPHQNNLPPQHQSQNTIIDKIPPSKQPCPLPPQSHKNSSADSGQSVHKRTSGSVKYPMTFFQNLIPKSIYNRESKKVLGFLSSEDLLLIALIFLFLENDSEDDNLILVLALAYVLLSEYIDFGEFSF